MPRAEVSIGVGVQWGRRPVAAAATVQGVWPAFLLDTFDAALKYTGLGWSASPTSASLADVTATMAQDTSITSWTAQLASAVPAGESITFRFVVNGTPDATLTITVNEGETGGRSADGSLDFAEGDEVAIEGVIGGAMVTSPVVIGFMLAYDAAKHFYVLNARLATVLPRTEAFACQSFSAATDNDFTATANNFRIPACFNPWDTDQAFSKLSVNVSQAVTQDYQPQIAAVSSGSPVSLVATDTATGDITATAVRPADATELDDRNFTIGVSGTDAVNALARLMVLYTLGTPNDNGCVIPSGLTASGARLAVSAATTLAEAHPMGASNSRRGAAITDFESLTQLRWPNLPGTLKNFLIGVVTRFVNTAYTVTGSVRINAANVITATTGSVASNTPVMATNTVDTAAVVADDLVNFGALCSAGSALNGGSCCLYAVGFEAA